VDKGVIPIIAHPERCMQLQKDLKVLYGMVKAGALVQITASSLTGKMGVNAKDAACSILKHNLAQVIATDTHGLNKRAPVLSEAVNIASDIIGSDLAEAMVTTLPQSIIDNKVISLLEPKKPN
jgi:protein-tyrosine phosphatase